MTERYYVGKHITIEGDVAGGDIIQPPPPESSANRAQGSANSTARRLGEVGSSGIVVLGNIEKDTTEHPDATQVEESEPTDTAAPEAEAAVEEPTTLQFTTAPKPEETVEESPFKVTSGRRPNLSPTPVKGTDDAAVIAAMLAAGAKPRTKRGKPSALRSQSRQELEDEAARNLGFKR